MMESTYFFLIFSITFILVQGIIPPDFNIKFVISFKNIPKKDAGIGKTAESDPFITVQNQYDHKVFVSRAVQDTKTGFIPDVFEFDWKYSHPVIFNLELHDFDPGVSKNSQEFIGRTRIYQPQLWYENNTGIDEQVLYVHKGTLGSHTYLQRDGQDSTLTVHYIINDEMKSNTPEKLKELKGKKDVKIIRID